MFGRVLGLVRNVGSLLLLLTLFTPLPSLPLQTASQGPRFGCHRCHRRRHFCRRGAGCGRFARGYREDSDREQQSQHRPRSSCRQPAATWLSKPWMYHTYTSLRSKRAYQNCEEGTTIHTPKSLHAKTSFRLFVHMGCSMWGVAGTCCVLGNVCTSFKNISCLCANFSVTQVCNRSG